MRYRKILVPVDFSKEADLALKWAVRLGQGVRHGVIYLLHVVPIFPVTESGLGLEQLIQIEKENAERRLKKWRKKVPVPFKSVILLGHNDLVDEVTAVCQRENIDVVVMTTHGRRGVARAVHPNVSEKVVRLAPCPVFVLHLNAKTKALMK